MTCAARMRRIRMMETMDRVYQNGSKSVEKDTDGTMTYYDRNGNVIAEARIKKVES